MLERMPSRLSLKVVSILTVDIDCPIGIISRYRTVPKVIFV